ncbi:MAG: CRISPR-associated endonuclease Cas1 [Anaerolineales bacterium]|nr:CRISPR-associated endonuclease Cas1 [Anaerolineales bacterium]
MAIVEHLIVEEFGCHVGKYSERLKVTKAKETLAQAPLLHLESVVIASSGVSVSAEAVRACTERGIPIHFISGRGTPYASLYSAGLTGTVLTRRAQLAAIDDRRGLDAALAFAGGKLKNQANLLKYVAKYRKENEPELYDMLWNAAGKVSDGLTELEKYRKAACISDIRSQLLGTEGRAAQHYWRAIKATIPAHYQWPGRQGRGARDPINSALNYGYGILYSQVERACVLAGLDPYAGFIHVDRPGKPSLVLDLIEEFRQAVVDRTIVGMANKSTSFEQDDHKLLERSTRLKIAEKVLARLDSPVRYENKKQPLRAVLQNQARHLATFLRADRETYEPFVAGW